MFSWQQSPYPGTQPSSSPYDRQQHIDSYLNHNILNQSTRKVSADDSTYDTVFQTKKCDNLIIRIHLPSSFPSEAPAMALVGIKATHPWIDSDNRITGFPNISSDTMWESSSMLLGDAVYAIVQHLQLNPPTVYHFTDRNLEKIQIHRRSTNDSNGAHENTMRVSGSGNLSGSSSHLDSLNNDSTSSTPPPPPYDMPPHPSNLPKLAASRQISNSTISMPPVPSNFPQYDAMKLDEMKELLEDDDKLASVISEMPSIQSIHELRKSMNNENIECAKQNLEIEDKLSSLREEVQTLQSTLQKKMERLNELQTKQQKLCAPPDTNEIIEKLEKAKREAYDESEDIAQTWTNGDEGLDGFLKEFLEKRTIHHVRAAKVERLKSASS
mmetsp:Transcript_2631/g.3714  ORF Transcript_2631/g.3714 Transcript_2631/m.3714 type:complete len:383 (+) Transcript_2631:44-1192(+)